MYGIKKWGAEGTKPYITYDNIMHISWSYKLRRIVRITHRSDTTHYIHTVDGTLCVYSKQSNTNVHQRYLQQQRQRI